MVEVLDGGGLGILGTLAGVAVGAFATYKAQERQLSHLDETRFQDVRLEYYARFTRAANTALAARSFGKRDSAASDEFIFCFETIRLIASPPVRDAANALHIVFGNAHRGETEQPISNDLIEEFHAATSSFVTASRAELRVPSA